MLLTVPGLLWEHEQQERVGNLGNHSQPSRQQPELHQPKNSEAYKPLNPKPKYFCCQRIARTDIPEPMSDNLDDVRQPLGKTLNRSCTTQYRGVSKHSRVWGGVKSDIGICKKLEDTITKYCDLYITHQVEFPGRTFGYGFCENMDQAEYSRGLLEPSETPETLRLQARSPN